VIAVCEVKARASLAFGDPAEAITPAKRMTVRRTAFAWAKDEGVPSCRLRFDVALVTGTRIDVIEDAF